MWKGFKVPLRSFKVQVSNVKLFLNQKNLSRWILHLKLQQKNGFRLNCYVVLEQIWQNSFLQFSIEIRRKKAIRSAFFFFNSTKLKYVSASVKVKHLICETKMEVSLRSISSISLSENRKNFSQDLISEREWNWIENI